ncbi:hypothetical protein EB796_017362 [Bugula neritina]|uniref:Uncharacterized protein n=1 Tax=Bugula neritina TaxID=10212 RepID=A0A7J7JFJ0_BUGNE|nr:hypothetical protein EB796_017362 [Bugula neritina]
MSKRQVNASKSIIIYRCSVHHLLILIYSKALKWVNSIKFLLANLPASLLIRVSKESNNACLYTHPLSENL